MCDGVMSSARLEAAITVAVMTRAATPSKIREMDMYFVLRSLSATEPVDAVAPAYDSRSGKSKEKPVIDHARRRLKRPCQGLWIGNAAKRCIEDIVPAIGDIGSLIGLAKLHSRRQEERAHGTVDGAAGRCEAEGDDLDRQGKGA